MKEKEDSKDERFFLKGKERLKRLSTPPLESCLGCGIRGRLIAPCGHFVSYPCGLSKREGNGDHFFQAANQHLESKQESAAGVG